MIRSRGPSRRAKSVAADQRGSPAPSSKAFTRTRIVALSVVVVLLAGLSYLRVSSTSETVSVPAGSHAGQLSMHSCTYVTEQGAMPADCGTLVVPENRANSKSRLIALPVTRILARSSHPLAPIFHLNGGPGITNMTFPQASRLTAQHDVVMVGYRGVDGSSVLNCPEVTAALEHSADYLDKASLSAYSQAFASCAKRLERAGVDLAGYTMAEQADDMEAVRVALGYKQIDLLSDSAGTRLAMVYGWRYPNSVERSAMVGVNPPGNFLYSGAETDQEIEAYSALCAKQPTCRARTADLAASMKHTAADMPSSWYSLPIKPGNVLVGTFLGFTDATQVLSPLSGPMTAGSWISAAQGDPSGLWFLSTMAGLAIPQSFTWGEFASIGLADAKPAERYFSSGADRGSIIGNPLTDFLWGAGGLAAWPANPGENQYTSVQNSNIPTLLIGGTLDFETPAQNATKELLPHLPNGHQVILSGLGHSEDFFSYEPKASTQLLTAFYSTGQVDTSLYTPNKVSFTPPTTQTGIARDLLGTMVGLALLAVIWLVVLAIRIRRRGGTGPKTGAWIRSAGPIVFGLGGCFLGALLALRFWPSLPLFDPLVTVVSVAMAIWVGVYAGWVRSNTPKAMRAKGIGVAGVGAVVGAALGLNVVSGFVAFITAIIGAAVLSNLSLLVLDIWTDRAASRKTVTPAVGVPETEHVEMRYLEPAVH
jgi:pimeloyl-ACP methyl ester carboxylesterase